MEDFNQYMNMEDFNQYLNTDSPQETRDAAQKVKEGLTALRIEEKVKAAAAERASLHRKSIWRWIFTAAVLVVMTGAVLLFWRISAPKTLPAIETTPGTPPQQEAIEPQPLPTTPPPQKQTTTPPSSPMAQAEPAPPRYAAPQVMLRGDDTNTNATQLLLNQIWYTDYPLKNRSAGGVFTESDQLLKARNFADAYIQLQRLERKMPQNDTLRYLKGYCLMELGQGNEALPYLESLQGHVPAWDAQLEWYRGLSLLQSGKKEAALSLFKQIANRGQPPYNAFGKKAVKILK
jgi:hypothetical protein